MYGIIINLNLIRFLEIVISLILHLKLEMNHKKIKVLYHMLIKSVLILMMLLFVFIVIIDDVVCIITATICKKFTNLSIVPKINKSIPNVNNVYAIDGGYLHTFKCN